MLWAKLEKAEGDFEGRRWLSLPDHSADVAAVFEAMLQLPLVTRRLVALAGNRTFPAIWRPRLCAHVALHDFGKANRGFQARRDPKAPLVGHVVPLSRFFVLPISPFRYFDARPNCVMGR
jgi:CRISPR-associated endonuclease/helicase Cas3